MISELEAIEIFVHSGVYPEPVIGGDELAGIVARSSASD
jgi:hypothetical protein